MEQDALIDALGIIESAHQDLIDCGIVDGGIETSLSCNLTGPRWGTPTILIGLGRSGSLATWQLMSSMVGDHTFQAIEDTGSEAKKSTRLFAKVFDAMGDRKCWLQHLLCHHQGRNCIHTWAVRVQVEAMEYDVWVREVHGGPVVAGVHPHVRVVHNLCDPLDVLMSWYKHKNKGMVAHCAVGHAACLESHRNARPMLPTERGGLVRLIGEVMEESACAGWLLGELRVPHLDVRYKDLYFAPDIAVEWWRVFSFLGVGQSGGNLTSLDLSLRMKHQATSNHSTSIREMVQNYKEVKEALQGN